MVAFFIIMNQVSVTAFRGEHVGTPQTGSHLAQFNFVVVPNVLAPQCPCPMSCTMSYERLKCFGTH